MPESKRFLEDIPLRSARQQVALLYYTNPIFRDWARSRYHFMISDEAHANGALKGWKTAQQELWTEVLERLPVEAPQYFEARKVSWERLRFLNKKDVENGHAAKWDGDMKRFQSEYGHYLETRSRREVWPRTPDPLVLPEPILDNKLFEPGEITNWGCKECCGARHSEASLVDRGHVVSVTPLVTHLTQVDYVTTHQRASSKRYCAGCSDAGRSGGFGNRGLYGRLLEKLTWQFPPGSLGKAVPEEFILSGSIVREKLLAVEPLAPSRC